MDCERLNSPVLSFVDINGKPLVGGKLYIYDSGTDTPATTYRDIEGTDANENPIILNGRGECVCFLDSSKVYKVVLKDSADGIIWEQDPVVPNDLGNVSREIIYQQQAINELSGRINGLNLSKMDKRRNATEGNFVSFDYDGNSEDSGYGPSDFYQEPEGGIPKTDLAQGVQDSLDLADTSLQPGDLTQVVRVVEQSFTDAEKSQARKNIASSEYRGNQFDIVQNHAGTGKYCKIAELDLTAHRHDYCYYYFTLCLEFCVNFDASTQSGTEHGKFLFSEVDYARLNVFGDNGQWLDYDNAVKYNGLSQSIKGIHILREKSGSKVTKYEFWLEVDNTNFNQAGSISVNVIANVGSWAYNGQASRSDRGMKAGWFKVYDATQEGQPMLLTDSLNTLTNSTFVEAVRKPQIAVIDNAATIAEAKAIVQKGDIPFMSFGAVYAWPYVMLESVQAWVFFNSNFLQVYKKANDHSEAVLRYILYREERYDFTINSTGESIIGKINDPSNWDNPNAPALEIDLYRASASAQNFTMRAYWKKGDTSDPAPTKDFKIVTKFLGPLNAPIYAYQVNTYTKTLSPTYTELVSIPSSVLSSVPEIEVEFKEPNSSRTYKLVCNMHFGQSRFIDMGYGY